MASNDATIGGTSLGDTLLTFRGYKRMADGALAQLDDGDFFRAPDPESNNVALGKPLRGADWKAMSIPKRKGAAS